MKKVSINKPKNNNKGKGSYVYKRTLKRIAICILIVLAVILIKNINTPLTNKATETIEETIREDMNIKYTVKQVMNYVKKLPDVSDKVVNVFNSFASNQKVDHDFVTPVEGEIISTYGENIDPISNIKTFQRGIDVLIKEEKNVLAITDGEVVEIGEGKSLGKYIKVKHSEEMFSFYGNCSEIKLTEGQKVKRGDQIAIINKGSGNENSYLHFELWVNGEVVDPTEYIPFGRKIL